MRLEIASAKAIRYACMNFHYAKAVPNVGLAFAVFNSKNEWCGVICYGVGANQHISSEFGLAKGTAIELLRMALNGKQESTTKAMALSIRLLKKYASHVRLLVSYADGNQNHIGTIYQATNWYYIGEYADVLGKKILGKIIHPRTIYSKYGTHSLEWLRKNVDKNAELVRGKSKYKYIYPLDKSLIPMCKRMAKPYPKKLSEGVESNADSRLDAKRVTTTLPSHDGDAKI